MKNFKFFLFGLVALSTIGIAMPSVAHSNQVQAVVRKRRIIRKKITPPPTIGTPVTKLTYNTRSHHFLLTVTFVKRVNYTIAYHKKGSDIMEALQGSKVIKKGTTLSLSLYAGSQSSHYFIAHSVTDGELTINGVDTQGNSFTVDKTFVIRGGRLVFTS